MKNMIGADINSSEQLRINKDSPVKKTTMSVPEMRELLGLKKTESYWLVHRSFFKTKIIGGQMRVDLESFEEWFISQCEVELAKVFWILRILKNWMCGVVSDV